MMTDQQKLNKKAIIIILSLSAVGAAVGFAVGYLLLDSYISGALLAIGLGSATSAVGLATQAKNK